MIYSSPFAFFVDVQWRFFVCAFLLYVTVFALCSWKDFLKFF